MDILHNYVFITHPKFELGDVILENERRQVMVCRKGKIDVHCDICGRYGARYMVNMITDQIVTATHPLCPHCNYSSLHECGIDFY